MSLLLNSLTELASTVRVSLELLPQREFGRLAKNWLDIYADSGPSHMRFESDYILDLTCNHWRIPHRRGEEALNQIRLLGSEEELHALWASHRGIAVRCSADPSQLTLVSGDNFPQDHVLVLVSDSFDWTAIFSSHHKCPIFAWSPRLEM